MLKKSEVLREGYIKGLKKAQSIISEMMEQDVPVNPSDVLKKCIDYLYASGEAREMSREQFIDAIYNNFVEDMVESYHKTPEEAEEAFADVEDEMYDDTRVEMFGKLLDTDERYTMEQLNNWSEANFANWDSFAQTEEGTLLNGDYFIFVDAVGKWLYA